MTDPPFIGAAAELVAKRFGVPMLVISQDVFPEIAVKLGRLRNPVVTGVLGLVVTSYLRYADRVVVIGETMERRIVAKGVDPARVRVISELGRLGEGPAAAARERLGARARSRREVRRDALRQRRSRAGPRHARAGVDAPARPRRPRRRDHRRRRAAPGAHDPRGGGRGRQGQVPALAGLRAARSSRSRRPTSTSSGSHAGLPATSSRAGCGASSPPDGP